MEYNAIMTVRVGQGPLSDDEVDDLMDALADFHPAVGEAPGVPGAWEVIVTLLAEGLSQAIAVAQALAATVGELEGLEVLPTSVFDRRSGLVAEDGLVGVTEAAESLGLTGQAVRDRIAAGTLPGRKVGRNWVIPAAALKRLGSRRK